MKQLDKEMQETKLIIEELFADGSDPEALYVIEHHVSCDNLAQLEAFFTDVFKLGFEISEVDEIDVQSDLTMFCADLISESHLDAAVINAQIERILNLGEKYDVNYDGWGTYFEGEDDDDAFEEEDE